MGNWLGRRQEKCLTKVILSNYQKGVMKAWEERGEGWICMRDWFAGQNGESQGDVVVSHI